jgi:uncharacterized membrane protein
MVSQVRDYIHLLWIFVFLEHFFILFFLSVRKKKETNRELTSISTAMTMNRLEYSKQGDQVRSAYRNKQKDISRVLDFTLLTYQQQQYLIKPLKLL